jgi:hypothetical protein
MAGCPEAAASRLATIADPDPVAPGAPAAAPGRMSTVAVSDRRVVGSRCARPAARSTAAAAARPEPAAPARLVALRSGYPVSAADRSDLRARPGYQGAPDNWGRLGCHRMGQHSSLRTAAGSTAGAGRWAAGCRNMVSRRHRGAWMIRGAFQRSGRRRWGTVGEAGAVRVGEAERRQPSGTPKLLGVKAAFLERRVDPRLQDPVRQQIDYHRLEIRPRRESLPQ